MVHAVDLLQPDLLTGRVVGDAASFSIEENTVARLHQLPDGQERLRHLANLRVTPRAADEEKNHNTGERRIAMPAEVATPRTVAFTQEAEDIKATLAKMSPAKAPKD